MSAVGSLPALAPVLERWEMGSDFHWDVADLRNDDEPPDWLPSRYSLFSSFTGALLSLIRQVPDNPVLHLPSYFWMGMVELLAPSVDIRYYREIPDGRGPDLDSLRAARGDLVLAVNLFGRADRTVWDEWAAGHSSVTVVEDHTHDPLSHWAMTSTADYCVSSLRKTLPVPDGAPIWSPRGRRLPEPAARESGAANIKLSAMLLKDAWLRGKGVRKSEFREFQVGGERALSAGVFRPTAFTRAALPVLDVHRLRAVRISNVSRVIDGLRTRSGPLTPLTHAAGLDIAPFNVQVLCENERIRDAARAHLADHRVYAPIHWLMPAEGAGSGDSRAAEIGSRIMTIPADHRYTPEDVDRLLHVINSFAP